MRILTGQQRGSLDIDFGGTASVTGTESAPSGTTEGVDCRGYSHCSISFYSLSGTNFTAQLWLFNGHGWVQAADAAGAVISVATIATSWGSTYLVAGYERVFMRISAVTGFTSVKRVYNLSGPGV